MFSALADSLDNNLLTGYVSGDMSGILKLAEALPLSQLTSLRWPTRPLNFAWTLCLCLLLCQQPMTLLTFGLSLLCSLAINELYAKGCEAVAAVLDKTQITSLMCAKSHPSQRLNLAWTLCLCSCICVSSL